MEKKAKRSYTKTDFERTALIIFAGWVSNDCQNADIKVSFDMADHFLQERDNWIRNTTFAGN